AILDPVELADVMRKSTSFLKILRLPVDDIIQVLYIAISSVPILIRESLNMKEIQMLKGWDFSGSPLKKVRSLIPVIVPLFISTIQKAENMAIVMELRGYGVSSRRSFYSEFRLSLRDYFAFAVMIIFISAILVL
ncbi:MAG: energy-coupling factor transporter transmembrane component T family protein, partial [Fidelibacterota bacterium]